MRADVLIDAGTPQSREMFERVKRAVAVTERLNRIPYEDQEAIRATWTRRAS